MSDTEKFVLQLLEDGDKTVPAARVNWPDPSDEIQGALIRLVNEGFAECVRFQRVKYVYGITQKGRELAATLTGNEAIAYA